MSSYYTLPLHFGSILVPQTYNYYRNYTHYYLYVPLLWNLVLRETYLYQLGTSFWRGGWALWRGEGRRTESGRGGRFGGRRRDGRGRAGGGRSLAIKIDCPRQRLLLNANTLGVA